MNFTGMKGLPWRSYRRDVWLEDRIAMTKKYGLAAIAGLALIALGFIFKENFEMLPLIFIGLEVSSSAEGPRHAAPYLATS